MTFFLTTGGIRASKDWKSLLWVAKILIILYVLESREAEIKLFWNCVCRALQKKD
jgi:hypothetical protein